MTRTLRFESLVMAAAVAALGACSSSNPTLTSISISPASATVAKGATVTLTANGNYSDGTTEAIASPTWTTSDPPRRR